MAARREVSQKKIALLRDLREAHQNGSLVPGELAPSVRDLSRKYELSMGVVAQQLQVLEQEGLLYTVPRAGTFVGQPQSEALDIYLCILPNTRRDREITAGFEEEIGRRGGTPLVMSREQILQRLHGAAMPPVSGVFYYGARTLDNLVEDLKSQVRGGQGRPWAEVNFSDFSPADSPEDKVGFDNFAAGRQAAQYLLGRKHRRIAFLGIHDAANRSDSKWSADRMAGWQTALERAGMAPDGLGFLPTQRAVRTVPASAELMQEAARRLLREANATAVVTANDDAAAQLIAVCRAEKLAAAQWPAIVSFDDTLAPEFSTLTSFRLPWEELGRTAASLLWERTHGQVLGAPVERLIALRMIPRLSCRAEWSLAESLQPIG